MEIILSLHINNIKIVTEQRRYYLSYSIVNNLTQSGMSQNCSWEGKKKPLKILLYELNFRKSLKRNRISNYFK